MTDTEIRALAEKFCRWEVPDTVCCDRVMTYPDDSFVYTLPRYGTNILTVNEAEQMIRYLLDDNS